MLTRLLKNSGLSESPSWARFVGQCLTLSFILHIIAAVRSSGFYHVDEHFQIIEFLNYKLGLSPAVDLPLEYGQFMRPWLMTAIFGGLTLLWKAMGITSPFDWALGYRLFCSAFGYLSSLGLILNCYRWFETDQKVQKLIPNFWQILAVLGMTLIWYLPALHARHSSENLSGSVFFIGVSLLALYLPISPQSNIQELEPLNEPGALNPARFQLPNSLAFTAGVLFGLAFEFRYQTGFMILGALFWLGLIARVSLHSLLLICGGMLVPFILGTLADHWGYGSWTFAPWNYLKYNLILNHVSDSDVTPWWDYFKRAFTETWPPLGFILLLGIVLGWCRNSKHFITWCTFPLFLIHEFIGHKELRFLFPLIHAGPVLLVLGVQNLSFNFPKKLAKPFTNFYQNYFLKTGRVLLYSLAGMNLIALMFTSILPAWSPVQFYERLYHFNSYGFRLYYKDENLFDFGGARMNFYKPKQVPLIHSKSFEDIYQELRTSHRPLWVFTPRLTFNPEAQDLTPYCHVEFSTLPAWPRWMTRLNPWGVVDRVSNWTLHRCEIH